MRNIFLSTGLFLLLCSGCDDFLDVKSNATYVIPKSIEDAQALMDDVFRMNEANVPTWGECFVDDYYLAEGALNFYAGGDELKFYIWDYQEYYGHINDWGYAYAAIYNANLAMELLGSVERNTKNQTEWANVMGSALFFRGFYFYGLLTNFAVAYDESTASNDFGIPLRLTANFNEQSVRASVSASFDQIIRDLEASVGYLPDYPSIVTRPSKGAAYAALAKVYLYKRDYEKALEYSERALQLNSQLMDFNEDADIINANPTRTPFRKFHKETIFYAEMRAGLEYPIYRGTIDSILYQSYSSNDLRLSLFFHVPGGLPAFRGHYSGGNRGFGGLSTNELYLTKAECLAFLDRQQHALDAIDQLLVKRIRDYSRSEQGFTRESLLRFVRDERRKELVYRNARFADIKRYNKEEENIWIRRLMDGKEYELEPNSTKYALPLPSDLIQITKMPQN